jgi:hypothetical protein
VDVGVGKERADFKVQGTISILISLLPRLFHFQGSHLTSLF